MVRQPKRKWEERRTAVAHFDVFKALEKITEEKTLHDCISVDCGLADPHHDPCCSSHGKPLCCKHYRSTHFVDEAFPCH